MEIIKEDYRFVAKNKLKDTDRLVAYAMSINFFEDMSQINDINHFIQIMQSKVNKEKQEIEEGIIYLTQKVKKENLKEYEIIFLKKYHQYLFLTLEKDVKEYYNNAYCNYLFSKTLNDLSSHEKPEAAETVKFINGKTISEIEDITVNEANSIMNKIRNNEEIDANDKKFLEELFLSIAYFSAIYKENDGEKDFMYDVVDYFNKYPINDLSTPRNMQLSILYNLSSRMINYPKNCAIIFSTEYTYSTINQKYTLGFYAKTSEGIPIIGINGLDTYDLKTEKDFLEKMFTIFHELRHFEQENIEFNEELKKITEMENYLIKNDREFYRKYHDSFFLESDADNYAIIQLTELYKKQYPKLVSEIIENQIKNKRIDYQTFYPMELEEYNKICQQNQTKSRH